MRKIYSLVLTVAILLVGTTAWATSYSVGSGDYATFAAFWSEKGASLTSADEITLVAQLDLNAGTYDFNGATLNCQGMRLKIGSESTYTIKNVTINADKYAFMVAAAATVNLEGVTLNSNGTATTKDGAAIYVNASATNAVLNLDANTTITGTDNTKGSGIWVIAKVTINNSATISGRQYGIYSTMALSLVNDGTIQNCYNGVYFTPNAASTFVNNGTVQTCTNYGVYVKPASGSESAVVEITNNGNGTISAKYYGLYLYSTSYASTVTNYGLIKGTSNSNNGMAVYARQANVINHGTITHTSGKATTNGIISNSAHITNEVGGTIRAIYIASGQSETGNLITNNGTIQFGIYTVIYSNNAKTTVYPVKAYVTNAGELTQTFDGEGYLYITNNGTATITKGTYEQAVTFEGSNNTLIEGGEFLAAPVGSKGYINPGDGAIKFEEGVGDLTIAPGYSWRSIDQMVCAISPLVEVTHANGSTATCLIEEAFANAQNGDVIRLLEDVTSYSSLWLGTEDMDGAYKSITLDLNGHTLYSAKNVTRTITLTHGALYIINSVPGVGGIVHTRNNAADASSDAIYVTGSTLKNVNPRTADIANLFTYLLVDEGVTITATGDYANGVSVFEISPSEYGNNLSEVNYKTNIYGSANGVANGVRMDIKGTINANKYGVKPNGNLRSPKEFVGLVEGVAEGDTAYCAFIHIFPSAVVTAANDMEKAVAVYASGYARWLIEGNCSGATGVYMKSGDMTLNDAVIASTWEGESTLTTGKGSGVAAGGNAVVIESNSHYSGECIVAVEGDTKISTEAENGAALLEVVDPATNSKVDSVSINGGSFSGDNAIVISPETKTNPDAEIVVYGTTVTGDVTVGSETDLTSILSDNVHTTVIENADGSTTVVVSEGAAPTPKTTWAQVAAVSDKVNPKDVKWEEVNEPATIGDGSTATTIYLGELQIISGSKGVGGDADTLQQLTIKKNATLNVQRLILNDYARIIVEAGAKLIVEGTQGINAPSTDNILLKTSETEQAIFLFNPAVSSNRHPNATVEFKTKSYVANSSNFVWERFGVPSYNRLEEMTYKTPQTFNSYVYIYDTSLDDWRQLGKIAKSGDASTLTTDELDKPFSAYNLICYNTVGGTEFVMKGALVGNVNADLPITETAKWATYSNSYSANVDIQTLISGLSAEMSATVWMYKVTGPNTYTWETVDDLEDHGFTVIPPMGAFILNKVQDGATSNAINYTDAVYNTSLSAAPVRRMNIADLTKAVITVTDENAAYDHVVVAASSMFTDEMDRGYDAEKYMNEAINMYVSNDNMSLAHFATDNLENTYLGFSCENGGTYTISFDKIQGEGLALIDLETNAYTLINAESMYQFSVGDNYANDYRFKIVSRQEMPTDVETIENATINNNGIYTITGQYVGEMNIWNTLPKGIYIVNGEKLIK